MKFSNCLLLLLLVQMQKIVSFDPVITSEGSSSVDVLVLICTQSFTGEDLVEDLLLDRLLEHWSVRVALVDETDIDWANNKENNNNNDEDGDIVLDAKALLLVASTFADGDPPNHAAEFADWLAQPAPVEQPLLPQLPYAVFALGDSSYAHYCQFGIFVDEHLNTKGAKRLLPLHKGDVQADQSGSFRIWVDQVVRELEKAIPSTQFDRPASSRKPFSSTGTDWRRSAIQSDSHSAEVTARTNLLPSSSKSVLHVNLTISTRLCPDTLQPGDTVGIYPPNPNSVVQQALQWLGLEPTMTTKVVVEGNVVQSITALELITSHVDLVGRATPSTLRALLPFVGTLELRALARDLTFVETKPSNDHGQNAEQQLSAFDRWVAGRRLTKLDLATLFECRPSLQALARAIGPMQPRLYSIATVGHSDNRGSNLTTIGLCISVVEEGLCSNYMADLALGSNVTFFFRKSQFHFIADDAPALLVAAGSGIGPYVGFLEEEEAKQLASSNTRASSPDIRLVYGCQTPDEILYRDRWSSLEESRDFYVQYAFSRLFGHPKTHAQDLIRKEANAVWKDVFEKGGRVYVCGRLELCSGVKEALVEVAKSAGGLSEHEARHEIQLMEKDGRLLTDCWSVDNYVESLQAGEASAHDPSHLIERLERHHATQGTTQCTANEEKPVDLSHIPAWPSYLRLLASGELERRVEKATDMFSACVACGRFCEVDRLSPNPDDWGECRVGNKAIVSAVDAHFGEEDCLKGVNGSGTIFFGACNLKCMYCQNWQLSMMDRGELVDDERLADYMLHLQDRGCHNINLVSPTHNVLPILRGILVAARRGLKLPIVWNTGGYDSVASLRLLDGIIDIYMPDAKYASRAVARKLSKIDNYPEINQAAIKEMHRQVGELQINPRTGLAWRGVLIRHLVLPSDYAGTDDVAAFLANEVSTGTYTHVMDYYRPEHEAKSDTKFGLNRKPSGDELKAAHRKARCARLRRLHADENDYDCAELDF